MSEHVNYIDDGYTEDGYIAAAPGFHGPLEFTYRPALAETRDKLNRAGQADVAKGHKEARDELAQLIKKWSLVDRAGAEVKCTPANLARLRPMLQDKLYGIVTGQIASDKQDTDQPSDAEDKPHIVEESQKN